MANNWPDMNGTSRKLLDYLAQLRASKNKDVEIEVGIGDMRIANAPGILVTYNLGSCLGVTLYDAVTRIGALLHIKLPEDNRIGSPSNDAAGIRIESLTTYADTVIPITLYQLQQLGAPINRLTAKIAGGGMMFPIEHPSMNIGQSNIDVTKRLLCRYGVMITAEDIGLDISRTMRLYTETGEVTVTTPDRKEKVL